VRVVANDGEPGPAWTQRQQDLGPEPVGVLVLVDENVIKASADFGGDGRLGHRVIPVQFPWQLRGPKPLLHWARETDGAGRNKRTVFAHR
jgi:hypothetical protein